MQRQLEIKYLDHEHRKWHVKMENKKSQKYKYQECFKANCKNYKKFMFSWQTLQCYVEFTEPLSPGILK